MRTIKKFDMQVCLSNKTSPYLHFGVSKMSLIE